MTDAHGYYALLGLNPTATAADIKRAFYAKAKELHPDSGELGDPASFQAVREAYQVLGNDRLRADYDRRGELARWEGETLEWIARADPPAPLPQPRSLWRWALGASLAIALALLLGIAHLWIEHRHRPATSVKHEYAEPAGPPPLSPADADADAAAAETLAVPTDPGH